ncbi:uncharacterized protein TRIADDRAFT_56567 [Trichoplax adhaerens]|uniref:MGAT4 conserved region domain-containing protein n=1 Tax=Trichoplax adhaerens TaxID=10228 RepID=B3RYI1_TRIAD|nr:hypothetical protein TRIADDRAFT_56567 [Trichoplax adhaerens]EDV25044.1 hypothetical protein TRIADDRAFT_56567 [Trichoplax adhaerens]|eukprot:XP_002112934.1 hypothetical protein TRIADDRAFT_56567 [Trichoplax adhaerens]
MPGLSRRESLRLAVILMTLSTAAYITYYFYSQAKPNRLRIEIDRLKDKIHYIEETAKNSNLTSSGIKSGGKNIKQLVASYEQNINSLKQELSQSHKKIDKQQHAIAELHLENLKNDKPKLNNSAELAIKKLINGYKEEVVHLKEDLVEAKETILKQQQNISVISEENKKIQSKKEDVKTVNTDVSNGNTMENREKTDLISADLSLPSIDKFLPHLANNPDALKPAAKESKGRTGVTLVIGIPTVKRSNANYLMQTLGSLLTQMNTDEKSKTLIVIFVAEKNPEYIASIKADISNKYLADLESGLIEIVSPSPAYYPDMTNLPRTYGDPLPRVKWRTKQNLDYAWIMMYSTKRGKYYLQLEDDVIAAKGFVSSIISYADSQSGNWFVIYYSELGFIGRLFKTSELGYMIDFLIMFHVDHPCDWIIENVLESKVCSVGVSTAQCNRSKKGITRQYKPSLFQHMGVNSSLAGKKQTLKDNSFRPK